MSLNKNILNTFFTQIPSLFISIVAGIFITRLLGPEGKGVFSVYTANIEILALLFSFGTTQGIVYFISNKKISEYKIQAIALSVLIISIILNGVIIFKINNRIIFVDNYDTLFYKAYLMVLFVITFSNSLMIAFLKAKKNFKNVNFVSIVNSVLNLLSFSILFVLSKYNIVHTSIKLIFVFSIILFSINFILYLYFFLKTSKLSPDFNVNIKNDIIPFYKFSFMGFLGMLVNFLNYRLDIWFVSYYKGSFQLGLYALAVNFAQFLMMISKIFASVMMPYMSESVQNIRTKVFLQYSRINFTIILLGVVFLYITGRFLLVFLYGVQFHDSIFPFKILLIGMIFTGTSQLFSSYLSASGRNDLCLYANVTGLLVTVILDIILIPKYGIIGSAYATSISYFLIFLVYFVILTIKEKINPIKIFLIKKSDIKFRIYENNND